MVLSARLENICCFWFTEHRDRLNIYCNGKDIEYIGNSDLDIMDLDTTAQSFLLPKSRNPCEFTAWFDYITNVLVKLSNAEECASREANTVKDFMKTKDTLLVQADHGWQRVELNRPRSH